MTITRVNWAEVVDARPAWATPGWKLWAVWPSPIDHDGCFAAAGFRDFADSDDDWWSDFRDLVERLLDSLESDRLALVSGQYPVEHGRVRPSLVDALVAAATDDNFEPCVVGAGAPPDRALRTSDGHPIVWINQLSGDITALLSKAARGRDCANLQLAWQHLL